MVQLYQRMITHLARKDTSKLTAMPPLEFVRLTQERWSDAGSAVASIIESLLQSTIRPDPPTREELTLAEDHLRRLISL